MLKRLALLLAAAGVVTLAGCSGIDENSIGRYKVGKPYRIKGTTYYPQETYNFTETGMASWYGPGFDGKETANGERFDEDAYTAAHPTLQMPSLVRVTNLDNGRKLVVRVNDRGPFHSRRVMDVSKGAAEALGFRNRGTARVYLELLGPESAAVVEAAKRGIDTRGAEVAMNQYGRLDERFAFLSPVPAPDPYMPAVPTQQVVASAIPVQQMVAPPVQQVMVDAPVYYPPIPVRAPALQAAAPIPVPVSAPRYQMLPIVSPSVGSYQAAPARPPVVYVQAGSLMSQANAAQLAARVGAMGPVQIAPASSQGLPYFRVLIGPLGSVEKANAVVNTLASQGRQASVVITDN